MGELRYIQTIQDIAEELEAYTDQEGERLSVFGPISPINILVGGTNSGKSRFMRGLAKCPSYRSFELDSSEARPADALSACTRLSGSPFHIEIRVDPDGRGYDPSVMAAEMPWLLARLRAAADSAKQHALLSGEDFKAIRQLLIEEIANPPGGREAPVRRNRLGKYVPVYGFVTEPKDFGAGGKQWLTVDRQQIDEDGVSDIRTVTDFVEALLRAPQPSDFTPPGLMYVPALRTAASLSELGASATHDWLAQSAKANYGLDSDDGRIKVFTGNQLYWTIDQDLKSGNPRVRNRIRNFERFIGDTFYEGETVDLVPLGSSADGGTHLALHIGEDIMRRFCDVGDGIQAIIILTYALFIAEPGTWIFIEEPERGLHPGLQRIFLETLAKHPDLRDKGLIVFLSTHSSSLLGIGMSEMAREVSVFAFQRCPGWSASERFAVRTIHAAQQSLLTLLGATDASVFLANCGVWVEGITDRKYIRAYLSAYLHSDEFEGSDQAFLPQEDVHYAFFEYAGSNLDYYLSESDSSVPPALVDHIRAQSLCNRIFLLADQDEGREAKHDRLRALESDSVQYYVTPGVEVENLISEPELAQALPELIPELTEEQVSRAGIRFSDYRRARLGSYLKKTLGGSCPGSVRAESGTLAAYYKGRLAETVAPLVSWSNMSEDARDLAKSIYQFIYRHNRGASNVT